MSNDLTRWARCAIVLTVSSDLTALRQSRGALDKAQSDLRAGILRAHAEGARVAEIAEASGYTRQRIYQMLAQAGPDEAGMRARLAELDAKWDALVDTLADGFMPGDAKAEQARRNVLNGRIDRAQNGVTRSGRRSGSVSPVRGMRKLPTVRAEARDRAESKLLRLLQDKVGEPRLDAIRLELDEAASLRENLAALEDARGDFFAGV